MELWPAGEVREREDHKAGVLPYRCEADDLVRLLEARARGWALPQIRSLNFSPKNFEGTLLTAQVLGMLRDESGELSEQGRLFALAAPAERPEILLAAIQRYEPYGLLLEAIFSGGGRPGSTEVEWVERWWATHGYGSSQSNRSEGATVFARLAEYVGWGSYIQGRRGHPSRIEWHPAPRERQRGSLPAPPARGPAEPAPHAPAAGVTSAALPPLPSALPDAPEAYSDVTLELRPGRLAQLRVPSTLTRAEKERLLSLLELLITTVPGE